MSAQHRTRTVAALTACGLKVLAARNGHGVRWARAGCTAALLNAGHSMDSAESLAASMARFSVAFADRADALVAEFNKGAIA